MAKVMDKTEETEQAAPEVLHFTAEERAARGKAARAEVPRTSHAGFELIADRDPVQILMDQAPSRVPELVPIRYGRMLVSPFTFYRGAAAIMAHDLAPTPRVGLQAQLCGDAHLANVGGYASPERDLVFDLNDFDETLPGPFEWDVKRLATSFEICGRDRNFTKAQREKIVLPRRARVPRVDAEARGDAEHAGVVRAARCRHHREVDPGARRREAGGECGGSGREGADEGQPEGVREAHRGGRRQAQDRLGSAPDHADQGSRRGLAGRDGGERPPVDLPQLPPDAAAGSPACPRGVPVDRHRPQGRRRRQRRDALLDPSHARQGPDRPALPSGQGGAGVRARAVSRQERVRQPRAACGRRPAADAVRERHLPRLGARRRQGHARRRVARLLLPPAVGLEDLARPRRRRARRPRVVRAGLRLPARARTRALGRPDRDRGVSRQGRHVRQGDRRVRTRVRGPEREGLRRARAGGQGRAHRVEAGL